MYLAHINLRPVDNGVVYRPRVNPAKRACTGKFAAKLSSKARLSKFVQQWLRIPNLHHELKPGMSYDPEVVF